MTRGEFIDKCIKVGCDIYKYNNYTDIVYDYETILQIPNGDIFESEWDDVLEERIKNKYDKELRNSPKDSDELSGYNVDRWDDI